ncbi:YezD family protein [Sporomusa sp.]|uniref:YezD family protein n=1 Tax=Sporomusa sp. TaxID=2078658 RepID=UPI002C43107A|nr:YezD family protein [Sporomusa sp.]HWR43916.1 YezD family protein [Sporomusa sp.]
MTKQETVSTSKHFSDAGLELIEQAVRDISFGSLTLVVQDSKVIQIEKLEKIRICEQQPKAAGKTATKATAGAALRTRILQSVSGMEYGKVAIQIQSGQIMQVERTEKYRVGKFTGLHGDGI